MMGGAGEGKVYYTFPHITLQVTSRKNKGKKRKGNH